MTVEKSRQLRLTGPHSRKECTLEVDSTKITLWPPYFKIPKLRRVHLSLGYASFRTPDAKALFSDPLQTLKAYRIEDVMPILQKAQAAVDAGHYAAGFIAYEAAPAL